LQQQETVAFAKQYTRNGLSDDGILAGIYGNVQDGRPMGNFGFQRVVVVIVVVVENEGKLHGFVY
jgi:hypothetical protein